jgi:hypothetical protein
MKKVLDTKALAQEAAFWEGLKQAAAANPGKACSK